jgi:glycosyltransferase 2 family protein
MEPKKRVVPRWRKLLPLLGFVLLAWVLSRLDLSGMGAALGRVPTSVLALSCGAFSLNFFLKAYRWHRLLLAQGIALPGRVSLAAFLSGQFYGQVTLGRVGEFFRVEALLERGVSAGAALASSVFDRLLDLFVVLLAASVLSALVLGDMRIAGLSLALMLVAALGVRFMLSALGSQASSGPVARVQGWFDALGRHRLLAGPVRGARDLAAGMGPMLAPGPLVEAALWTLVSWGFYFEALFVLASGLHIDVARPLLTATAAFAALSALLPVTVSGLGARELIYITVLKGQGVSGEAAAVLSLLHLFIMSVSATLFGLAGVLWRQRQRL